MSTLPTTYIKEKWQHAGFQKYFKNTGWLLFSKILTLAIAFFVGISVARYLGPTRYGTLNYILSFVGLFSFISSLGIDGIINRDLIKYPEKRDSLLGTAFVLKSIGGVATILLTVGAISTTNDLWSIKLLIILVSLSYIFQTFNVIDTYFQSNFQAKNSALVQIISNVISACIKVILLLNHARFAYFVFMYLLDYVFIAFFLSVLYKKNNLFISDWKFDKDLFKQILKSSWLLILSTGFYFIYMRIDQVMIKHLLGDTSLGIYSAGVKISEIWYFLPGIICTSLFPAIINAKKTDNIQHYENRLKKFYSLFLWLPIFMSVIIFIFSPLIIKVLYGIQYLEAIYVLRIYVWAGIAVSLGIATGQYLITENYVGIITASTCLGALTNIILNIILIPRIGINGASLASLVSYFIVPLSMIFFKKTRRQILLITQGLFLRFN